jgi:hypothetical protein
VKTAYLQTQGAIPKEREDLKYRQRGLKARRVNST